MVLSMSFSLAEAISRLSYHWGSVACGYIRLRHRQLGQARLRERDWLHRLKAKNKVQHGTDKADPDWRDLHDRELSEDCEDAEEE